MQKLIALLAVALLPMLSFGQDCEQILKNCEKYFKDAKGNSQFTSDGQVYAAFLDRQTAEYNVTLYGGGTYRIVANAGSNDNYALFTVKDLNGNIIFRNSDHKNAPYWDFKVPQTIPVVIETGLDADKKFTGCVVMLIGFKKK